MAVKKSTLVTALVFILAIGGFFAIRGQRTERPFQRIVFVTIDTLRQDHLAFYGWPRSTSPFLEKLAREGVVFDNAYSACSHTAPSHTTMFTSLYPFEHNVLRNHEKLDDRFFTLQKLLQKHGYETAAIPAVRFLEGKVGFDTLPAEKDHPKLAEISKRYWFRTANHQVDRAIHWLKNGRSSDKFFLWLHLYDTHQWKKLGRLPKEYITRMSEQGDRQAIIQYALRHSDIPKEYFGGEEKLIEALDSYNARIRYVDDHVKMLYEAFEEQGLASGTLWVFTSDHGEGLGEHHYAGHGEFLYEEQLRIPLLFYAPGLPSAGQRVGNIFRTVDFLPTLASLAGVRSEELPSMVRGVSFGNQVKNPALPLENAPEIAFSQRRPKDNHSFRKTWEKGPIYAIQTLDDKLIDHTHAEDELYHLPSDPAEAVNKAGQGESMEGQLRSQLESLLQGKKESTAAQEDGPEAPMTDDQIEELRSLGYL